MSTGSSTPPIVCGKTTVSVNAVVWLSPPPIPVTVTRKEPVGVDGDALRIIPLVEVGKTDEGLKPHEAPAGNPLVQARLTDCVVPPVRVTMIVLDAPKP